jgi:hypothetical protein
VLALAVLAVAFPSALFAWGNTGHRMLGEAAVRALPTEVPAFLRTAQAARDVGELSREPDRSKGSGKLHDSDRDPGHFVDLDDDGKVLGGPPMVPLAATRAEYETQLRVAGIDQWKAGYLPYSIVDRWQQLTTDFAYWRVLKAAEANPKWRAHRAWFKEDRARREALILKDLGELSHFVGDGSQPLQWLGRLSEPARLFDSQTARAVRERSGAGDRETRGRCGKGRASAALQLSDRTAGGGLSHSHRPAGDPVLRDGEGGRPCAR